MSYPTGNTPSYQPAYGQPTQDFQNAQAFSGLQQRPAPLANGFPQSTPQQYSSFPANSLPTQQYPVQSMKPMVPNGNGVPPQFHQFYPPQAQQQQSNPYPTQSYSASPASAHSFPAQAGAPGPNLLVNAKPPSMPTAAQPVGFVQPPSFNAAPQPSNPSFAPPPPLPLPPQQSLPGTTPLQPQFQAGRSPVFAPSAPIPANVSAPPMTNGYQTPPMPKPAVAQPPSVGNNAYVGSIAARSAAVPAAPPNFSPQNQQKPPSFLPTAPAPPSAQQPTGMHQGYGQPPAQQNYGQPNSAQQPYPQQQQPMQQMSNQFGQMNVGGNSQFRPDSIDLMSERNVQQFGFDDVDVSLPQNMANPEARVDPNVFRSSINMIPQSDELLKKSRLPLAITLHPFRDCKNLNIIQTSNIVRCRYCRTYINPFVYMPDHRHWKCNLCNRNNEVPDDFCWDPTSKQFGDPRNRPEIRHATVEFIAPSEYMLRPPQPAVYAFVLDVSDAAIQSGYLHTLAEQLVINLDQLPGDDRTLICFVAVDACLHFFMFNSERRPPVEMVIDDVTEPFLPSNAGLLVSLKKYKENIRSFIQQIPTLFTGGPTSNGNCVGAALQVVDQLIAEIGGRVSVFQCSLPNLGPGALQPREEAKSDSGQNFGPATDFYKNLSLECTGHHIGLDLFMFNSKYVDVATLSEMAKFSTGCVYYFPNYNLANDWVQPKRFEKTLTRYLTRKIGFEAVLRIRTTRGVSLTGFYGNFFVRSPDLLAYANCNPDSALAAQVTIDEKLASTVCFQAALLYTSSKGDRRIRVHTMCLPTTGDIMQLYNSFDLKATVSYLAKIGVERSMSGTALSDSREAIVNAVVDSIGAFQKAVSRGGGIMVPRSGHLRLLPTFALAMLKHPAFTSSRGVRLDDRVAAMLMLRFSPLEQILSDIYPKLYALNELQKPPPATHSEDGSELDVWPQPLPLTFEHIYREGVYLMEAGTALYLYVGANSDPSFVHDVFGCPYDQINEQTFRELPNDLSRRVHAFIKHVTTLRFFLGPLIIVKEHSPLREAFIRRLVDDRTESTHSYVEFLQHIKREINQ